jgi:hypothetical protein
MSSQVRLVAPETFSEKEANWLWERVSGLDHCFDDLSRGRGDVFAARLMAGMVFTVGSSALVTIENIIPRVGADIHFFSWQPMEFRDMLSAGEEILGIAFQAFDLQRITAALPEYNLRVARLAKELGFEQEGILRRGVLHQGRYWDVHIFGLLREEAAR